MNEQIKGPVAVTATCGNCGHWVKHAGLTKGRGLCFALPPTPVLVQQAPAVIGQPATVGQKNIRAQTKAEEGCGLFFPRDPNQPVPELQPANAPQLLVPGGGDG